MSDSYIQFVNSTFGRAFAKRLGLPQPTRLERYVEGNAFLIGQTLLGKAEGSLLFPTIQELTQEHSDLVVQAAPRDPSQRFKTVIYDATGIARSDALNQLQRFFSPILKNFGRCTRVVVIGWTSSVGASEQRTAQRAILGFVKALAKEMRAGGTVNLIQCSGDCQRSLAAPLAFFASDRSVYVSGQSLEVVSAELEDWSFPQPLAGRNILVTGAARGIGRAIAQTVRKRGGKPTCVDIPQAEKDLRAVASELGGDWLTLDITAPDASKQIARHFGQTTLHAVVHNAGITRDKKLVNMKPDMWDLVLKTNLSCQERINESLISEGVLTHGGRIVSVSSISGIAGNAGQTNYATSKAGVIGMVEAYAEGYWEKGITINAVAPGFIETKMVATIPFAMRQAGRRLNSLSQGGLPEDVAEAVAFFLQSSSQGVKGNVLRVCGQALMGA